jgi:hypothetical protein
MSFTEHNVTSDDQKQLSRNLEYFSVEEIFKAHDALLSLVSQQFHNKDSFDKNEWHL